jgi:hypothetical protein
LIEEAISVRRRDEVIVDRRPKVDQPSPIIIIPTPNGGAVMGRETHDEVVRPSHGLCQPWLLTERLVVFRLELGHRGEVFVPGVAVKSGTTA